MDNLAHLFGWLAPVLLGIFGAGGAGTAYFRWRSKAPIDMAGAKKIEAEASMVVVEGWQRLAETLMKQCDSLRERVEILERKSRELEENRTRERMAYEKKINALEIELSGVISSSNYKDKQLEEQGALIIKLQERVSDLERELAKYTSV